jgi:hypothetical protein
MKPILIILLLLVLLATYAALTLAFNWLWVALWRRKIARLDRLDGMDNGSRLVSYFLEMNAAKEEIMAKWGGEFPPGTDGKIVRELAGKILYCINQKPSLLKALHKPSETISLP